MSAVLGASLPSTWSSAPLKHVTTLLNRGSAPNYVEAGSVRAISQAANQKGSIEWSRTRFHDYAGDPLKLKGYLLRDDILINSTGTGTVGRVGYFTEDPDGYPCMADTHITLARMKPDELDPRFGFYWLGCQVFQDYLFTALVVGATNQIELNRDRLGDAPVPLPPLHEQRRIADFLDAETACIDQARERFARLSQLLTERSFSFSDETVGSIAEAGLRGERIKALCRPIDTRAGASASDLPLLSVSIHHGVTPHAETSSRPARADSLENYKVCSEGDIILNRMRAFQGAVGVSHFSGLVSPDYLVLRVDSKISANLLHHVFRSPRFIGEMSSRTRGIGSIDQGNVRTPRINWEDLGNIRLHVPSKGKQFRLLAALSREAARHEKLRGKLEKQMILLGERRQALITAAATGQFDVSTASGRNVTEGVVS